MNPRAVRKGNEITWDAFDGSRTNHILYAHDIALLAEKKQYSYQAIDGSIFQMYYTFDKTGRNLRAAGLTFMQNPRESATQTTDAVIEIKMTGAAEEADGEAEVAKMEKSEVEETVLEINDARDEASENVNMFAIPTPIAWLRIDYSPDDSSGCVHSPCHMHLSMCPSIRLPIRTVPTPEQFLEAIVAWFYPDSYKADRLDENGSYKDHDKIIELNRQSLKVSIDAQSLQILHLAVPGIVEADALRSLLNQPATDK